MPDTQYNQRNAKTTRRAHDDQYADRDCQQIKPKTLPKSKLQTIRRDYRLDNDIEEDFNRTLHLRKQTPRSGKQETIVFNRRAPKHQGYRTNQHHFTDSDTGSEKTTQYGTFPRYRTSTPTGKGQNLTQEVRPPLNEGDKYEAFRSTYKFVITTSEPTTLIGDYSRRTYAKIPDGTTITADSHQKGTRGERTYQSHKETQTAHPWMSSFERSFAELSM